MQTGLVLEGGGVRGIYTAGVLDVFMENHWYANMIPPPVPSSPFTAPPARDVHISNNGNDDFFIKQHLVTGKTHHYFQNT